MSKGKQLRSTLERISDLHKENTKLVAENARLQAQRDIAVEALRGLIELPKDTTQSEFGGGFNNAVDVFSDVAREALAKIEGQMIDIGNKRVSVHISGGGQSAVCLARCLEWYGYDRVSAVFADTRTESPDTYRFLDELSQRFGVKINRLDSGKTIWDVFDEFGVIVLRRGGGACKASLELKQKPLDRYYEETDAACDVAIATGLSWMEPERQQRLVEKLKPRQVIFPLNVQPRLSECDTYSELKRLGLSIPDAYLRGYPHNNCGGGCVLAGVAQWMGLLKDYPDRFRWHEMRERRWRFIHGSSFTVLRDRRGGGKAKSYTLEQLRLDVEGGREPPGDFRSGCGCMVLGGLQQTGLFDLV